MQNIETSNWALLEGKPGIVKPDTEFAADNYEIIISRSGAPTIRVLDPNGRPVFLHSSVDPEREANRLVENMQVKPGDMVIVQGFGFGYLVEALLLHTPEQVPLIVIEPDIQLFMLAMRTRLLDAVLTSSRITLVVKDDLQAVENAVSQTFDSRKHNSIQYASLPGTMTVYKEFFDKIPQVIKTVINAKIVWLNTNIHIGGHQTTAAILNMADYLTHPGFKALYGKFTNVPAIIVSAGPSLDKNIDLLHEVKGKAVIIAVGTSVKALQKRNIDPDFIVTIDPMEANWKHFQNIDTKRSCLIANLHTYRKIVEAYEGPMLVAAYANPILNWLEGQYEMKGSTVSGGSVANDAMTAAYQMGANPIILIGQDLAYSDTGRSHASGTTYEKNAIEHKADLSTFYVKANNGGEVLTNRGYYLFIRFFEKWFATHKERMYINATEGGAYMEGTQVTTLREAIDQYCAQEVDAAAVVAEIQANFQPPSLDKVRELLEKRMKEAENVLKQTTKVIQKLEDLQKACERNQGDKINKYVKAVRSVHKKFEADKYIIPIAELFIHKDVHGVIKRTYHASYDENDSYEKAIGDYQIYYHQLKEATKKVVELIETAISQMEMKTGGTP